MPVLCLLFPIYPIYTVPLLFLYYYYYLGDMFRNEAVVAYLCLFLFLFYLDSL